VSPLTIFQLWLIAILSCALFWAVVIRAVASFFN